jgi:hypothetical protein
MPVLIVAALAVLAQALVSSPSWADNTRHHKARRTWHNERVERDCTPINGRFGYYGNPWCDTGSSRPPDIEFRERQRLRNR